MDQNLFFKQFFATWLRSINHPRKLNSTLLFGTGVADFWGLSDCIYPFVYKMYVYNVEGVLSIDMTTRSIAAEQISFIPYFVWFVAPTIRFFFFIGLMVPFLK